MDIIPKHYDDVALHLRVVSQTGDVVHFKIRTVTVLQKLMDAYCEQQGLPSTPGLPTVDFLHNGRHLLPTQTAGAAGLADNDQIQAVIRVPYHQSLSTVAQPWAPIALAQMPANAPMIRHGPPPPTTLNQRIADAFEAVEKLKKEVTTAARQFETKQKQLESKQNALYQLLQDEKSEIDCHREREKLEADAAMEKVTQMLEKITSEANKAADVIKLNVGGTLFTTTKATLLSQPDSYFTAMLGSRRWQPQADGSYFIDRNADTFKIILEFLRTGALPKEPTKELSDALLIEADYFQISLPLNKPPSPLFMQPDGNHKHTWDPHSARREMRGHGEGSNKRS